MTVDPTDFGYRGFCFNWGDHICAIFDDPTQQMEIMGQFIPNGLRAVQRCVWAAPPASADRLRRSLTDIGGDLRTLEGSNQLVIISDVDFYLREGLFEPERTMDLLRTLLADGQREGYATMRMATDVLWLRDHHVDPDLWEQFEARLTEELRDLPAVMVCQYDRRQLPGAAIVAAFRTHPVLILSGEVRQNPFAVSAPAGPPDVV
jgi:hypothetical protein